MQIISGKQTRPRRIMLYGIHGVGKSTWASEAPHPLFLNIEDGIADIDAAKTEHLKAYADVVSAISWLIGNPNDYQTIVLDTVDWLERQIFDEVARSQGKKNIEEIGYGKGYQLALSKWEFLLSGLNRLRDMGRTVILLCHAKVRKFTDPGADSYERYEPAIHESGSRLLQEWCDEVLFAKFRVLTRTEDQGFNKKRTIALGGKERIIRTSESAAEIAKNRLRLPDELPMQWASFAEFLPSPGNVAGLVVNGTSKVGVNGNE